MMVKDETLPVPSICRHSDFVPYAEYFNASLVTCTACKLVVNKKIFKKFNPAQLYENYYRNETGVNVQKFSLGLERIIRLFRLFRAFKIRNLSRKADSILDIGCGRGFMLYYLRERYAFHSVAGTQISKPAADFCRNRLHLDIYEDDLLNIPFGTKRFDIITLWHVLEHVQDPEGYIQRMYELLNPGGMVVIEVPNFTSWTQRWTGPYWLGLDPEYHMAFFTPDTLSALLLKHGFTIKQIHTFSLEYSTFISVQSIVSRITGTYHLVFYALQKGTLSWKLVPHALLFILLTPVCMLINLFLYFSTKGEVLLITALRPDAA